MFPVENLHYPVQINQNSRRRDMWKIAVSRWASLAFTCGAGLWACFSAPAALAACPAPSGPGFGAAAQAQFECSSARPLNNPPAGEREFKAKLDFPATMPP